jgi:hypothetical protein
MGDDGGGLDSLITVIVIIALCVFLGYYLCIIKKTPKPLANLFTKYLSWPGCGSIAPAPAPGPPPGPGPPGPAPGVPPVGYDPVNRCAAGPNDSPSGGTGGTTLPLCNIGPGIQATPDQVSKCAQACADECNKKSWCNAFMYNTGLTGSNCYLSGKSDGSDKNIPCDLYPGDECCMDMDKDVPCYGVYKKTSSDAKIDCKKASDDKETACDEGCR